MPETVKNILFVCTGNTCRSVFAEYIMKKLDPLQKYKISSAGVLAHPNLSIPPNVAQLLRKENVQNFRHIPSKISKELVDEADYVFVMERYHKDFIADNFPQVKNKVFLLAEQEIEDPIGGSEETYRKCLKEIKKALGNVFKKLESVNHVP